MPIAALCGSLHHHQCIFVAERDCRAESVYAASAAFGRFLKVRKMNDNVAVVVVIGGCNSTPPSLGVTATVTVRSDDDHERREVLGATRKEYNTSAAVEIATQQPQRQTTTSNETTATSSTPPPSANEPPSPSCASVKTGSPSGPYIASTTFLVRVMEGQERHGRHVRLPDNIDSGTIWVELASYLYDSAPTPYIIKFEQGCVCMDHPLTTFVFEELCRRMKLQSEKAAVPLLPSAQTCPATIRESPPSPPLVRCVFVAERDCRPESVHAASAAFVKFLQKKRVVAGDVVVLCKKTTPAHPLIVAPQQNSLKARCSEVRNFKK